MRTLSIAAALLFTLAITPVRTARAADHGDAPNVDHDSGADIADVFTFLDPNDPTKVIIIGTVHGFIVPAEAVNFATFDPHVQFKFDIENTGDTKPDTAITVTFTERTSTTTPQIATVTLPGKKNVFTAPTTPATLAATPNPQTVTTDPKSGVAFFAGEVDDPFFFDLPGFNRFVASVLAHAADPTQLQRGRDAFAGYNVLAIALSVPRDLIRGAADNNVIGVDFKTFRRTESVGKNGVVKSTGAYRQVDRVATPAVNVALIPFARKSEYNSATTIDDGKGRFQTDIVATLTALGTDTAHINTLAGVAVTKGDYLHLNLTITNTGTGGGTNAEAAFPNGRRLKDDVIDTILTIIANGTALGDNVNASDVPPQDAFPFVALPQQPRATGVTDDNTRN